MSILHEGHALQCVKLLCSALYGTTQRHKEIKIEPLSEKSKAKLFEWESQKLSQGTRYSPVEVRSFKNLQTLQRNTTRKEIDSHNTVLHEVDALSMNIDEIFKMEEWDVPDQRRVS